jgi:phosphate starvation-inducible membrane PsiE
VRRLVALLLFLVLADDATTVYRQYIGAPFDWVEPLLVDATPIKIRLFDIIMLGILVAAANGREGRGLRTPPMRRALLLVLGTVVAWFAYGMLRGGDFRCASWQTYLMLSMVLTAFTVAATFYTAEHYALLAKTLMAVAIYRAVMCWIMYFEYILPGKIDPPPIHLTTHHDTVVWVTAIVILIVNALDARSTRVTLRNLLVMVLIAGAIQFNTRRLAWVSLTMALVVMYFLLPLGPVRRRAKRVVLALVPVVAIYAVVGWGSKASVVRPLQAFSSVTTEEDDSTKARNCENLSLIATAHQNSVFLGTGWGHKYIELTNKYSIAEAFELWPYIPHNSILGLFAYTGVFGVAGFWLAVPTAVFLNARVARLGSAASLRSAGVVGAAQIIVCGNQLYGDMGSFSPGTMYVLAVSYAMALRLPAVAGVWGNVETKPAARAA